MASDVKGLGRCEVYKRTKMFSKMCYMLHFFRYFTFLSFLLIRLFLSYNPDELCIRIGCQILPETLLSLTVIKIIFFF